MSNELRKATVSLRNLRNLILATAFCTSVSAVTCYTQSADIVWAIVLAVSTTAVAIEARNFYKFLSSEDAQHE